MTQLADDLRAAPNPGSDEAIAKGCKCPVLDNAHGRGYLGKPGIFVLSADCPLHGHAITDAETSHAE